MIKLVESDVRHSNLFSPTLTLGSLIHSVALSSSCMEGSNLQRNTRANEKLTLRHYHKYAGNIRPAGVQKRMMIIMFLLMSRKLQQYIRKEALVSYPSKRFFLCFFAYLWQ
jgi:hypothetical protein